MCNLASIALPHFVTPDLKFDFNRLFEVTKVSEKPCTLYSAQYTSLTLLELTFLLVSL